MEGIPDWIFTSEADQSPFKELLRLHPSEHALLKAFYVKGQPGMGKLQMLLYPIHCLMQLDKVAILYVLPNLPVFTILVDKSNQSNPFTVRSHPSSLHVTWYTSDFLVIHIADTADSYPNKDERGIFTVFTASLPECNGFSKDRLRTIDLNTEEYPFWKRREFYTMMKHLGMTEQEHWIRPVPAEIIIKLHPFVISLLETHGYVVEGTPEMHDAGSGGSIEPAPQPSAVTSANRFDEPPLFRDSNLLNPNGVRHPPESHGNSVILNASVEAPFAGKRNRKHVPYERSVRLDTSSSSDNLLVRLNVIEVFGLSPRALATDLSDAFRTMSEVFGRDGVTRCVSDANLVFNSLSASHLKSQPVSEFASRVQKTVTTIQTEDFLHVISSKEIFEALRGIKLDFKVNQQLFRSHMMFTVFTAIPDFTSFYFRFPSITRCPMLLSRLCTTPTLIPNVLYYEALYDPVENERSPHWIGMDSFIFFLGLNSITMFTFLNAVDPDRNETGNELIDLLRTQLENGFALTMPGVKVYVFFVWIVKPGDVPEYLEKANHPYKTGVISVSDLIFNECLRMTGPLVKRPKIQLPLSKSTQGFKDCFVMMRNLMIDA
ncbi:hypothetical protein BLNAU_17841 [Blattamonas nauphoetae]|uniref:Uncharacterized protein n=1 Tax=Blattamonas nauphoetae TaxID=2049346 RepID=A0ABQ9X610_9EUKA|nr:hypothetical protein BLNAU_17841 [Blattamonas nauphoetae]